METAYGLEFIPETHEYRYKGVKVPSVTTALAPYNGLQGVDPEVLRLAALFGTHVHEACHLFNIGNLDRDSLNPTVAVYLAGWEKFLDESGAVVIYSEARVVSPKYGYAGTLDSICAVGKTNRLYDIKTGSVIPPTVGPQLAAYNEAWKEMTGQRLMRRYVVHLKPNGYNLVEQTDPRDWDIFKAALTLHRWRTGE